MTSEADSMGGEEPAMTEAPRWFRTAPLFQGSGRAGIEVVISRQDTQAPSWEGREAKLPCSPQEEAG